MPTTSQPADQQVYICARCQQPIRTSGVLSSGRAVHVPTCPTVK